MEKKEAQQYKSLVEPILGFVDACLKEGDEDNAYHCFDAFSYLAEAKLNILDSHLGLIVEYAAGPNVKDLNIFIFQDPPQQEVLT